MRVSRIKAPNVTPVPQIAKRNKKQESGSEAKPDSEQATSNRHTSPPDGHLAATLFKPPQLTPSSCQPKPEFLGISTCCSFHNPACPTDSFLFYVQFLSHTLYTRKDFLIADQPVFAYRQPRAFGCIMIAVRYSPCSSQAEKISMGNDGVRWQLGFGGSAVRQVTLRSLTAFSLFRFALGNVWAAAQTCLREFFPQTPISASRRLKAAFVCQPSVR